MDCRRSSSLSQALAVSCLSLSLPIAVEAAADQREDEALSFEIEAELEFALEREPAATVGETTFDEVGFLLAGDWWEVQTGIKLKQGVGLRVEEGGVQVHGESPWDWFLRGGRTEVPFARLESHFVEDAVTIALGEIDADALVLGLGRSRGELGFALLKSRAAGAGADVSLHAQLHLTPEMAVGAGWTSDLGEAVELREIRDERDQVSDVNEDSVAAASIFLGYEWRTLFVDIELLSALGSFAAGSLAAESVRPLAVDSELAMQISPKWMGAVRVERSREFPEQPTWQYGAALWYTPLPQAEFGVDLLHAEGEGGEWPRQLISFILALSFGNAEER